MPEEGIDFLDNRQLLSREEIERLCLLLSKNGITKVRITGGEPFVRKDLTQILNTISPWFRSVNITTNASLLHRALEELHVPNLGSLNISLDSLNPMTFFAITKRDRFKEVWQNIMKCYDKGWRIKLNAVIMRGINDHEIPDFLDLAQRYEMSVRFIEAMPFNGYDQNSGLMMDHREILEVVKMHHPNVQQKHHVPQKSASIKYVIPDFAGDVGIIPAYSRTLCGTCNRVRITADGQLMNCLYSTTGYNLKKLLRSKVSDDALLEAIQNHLFDKPVDGFAAEEQGSGDYQSMTTIGG
jgi:cyclic pyranopterin phosphate synthase